MDSKEIEWTGSNVIIIANREESQSVSTNSYKMIERRRPIAILTDLENKYLYFIVQYERTLYNITITPVYPLECRKP